MPNINKRELPEYRIGNLRVYLVDSFNVGIAHSIKFTGGGHGLVYSFIPSKPYFEIWIGDELKDDLFKSYLYHELFEVRHMAQGMVYDDAHNLANRAEGRARKQGNLDELIKLELSKYSMTSSTIYNGTKQLITDGSGLQIYGK